MAEPVDEEAVAGADVELARELLAEWDQGKVASKSQIEIRVWDDATSHGRRFDRFIRRTLGETTSRASRQTERESVHPRTATRSESAGRSFTAAAMSVRATAPGVEP